MFVPPAVDVNIYASSPRDAWPLVGNHENTDVGSFLADYLDVDLGSVTKKLRSLAYWSGDLENIQVEKIEKFSWMGNPLGENVRTEGLDTYHGEFKRSTEGDDEVVFTGGCGCGAVH